MTGSEATEGEEEGRKQCQDQVSLSYAREARAVDDAQVFNGNMFLHVFFVGGDSHA